MLLTATLCLLAFGAVMVYSASSARDLLQRQRRRDRQYLVRYLVFGAHRPRRDARARAPRRRAAAQRFTPLLLIGSFALLLLVLVPGVGVEVNGARRWLGAGPLQFQPSELMKLALVLYVAQLLADAPRADARASQAIGQPARRRDRRRCLLIVAEPDLGTALVIASRSPRCWSRPAMPLRYLGYLVGGRRRGRDRPARARPALPAGAADRVPDPWATRHGERLPGGAGADRARLGRPVRRRARASRCRRSSTCPRRTPTSSSR